MKIKIKKIIPAFSWSWKTKEKMCGICQQSFETCCAKCSHPIQCVPCVGNCAHVYHLHCIESWLKRNEMCPLCRETWKYKKIFSSEFKSIN